MTEYIRLQYCPRVITGTLQRPIRRCRWRGRQMPANDIRPDECRNWPALQHISVAEGLTFREQLHRRYLCPLREEANE